MGLVSKAIDKLPAWAKVILMALVAVGSIYYIAHYGVWSFVLHTIFSPDL